jgi:hypothetical protein
VGGKIIFRGGGVVCNFLSIYLCTSRQINPENFFIVKFS